MLKLLFGCLLAANVALFAYNQGYLNTLFPDGREPGRMSKQFNADKIKLLPASVIFGASVTPTTTPTTAEATPANGAPASSSAASVAASTVTAPVVTASAVTAKAETPACMEIGNFDVAESKRFETRLAPLALGNHLVAHTIVDDARYIVFIPSQGSKEGADRKAGELRKRGVTDFYIMQDGNLRWGISLGIFKTEDAANAHLFSLNQQGVRTARVGDFNPATKKTVYQLRGVDVKTKEAIQKIKADFPKQEIHSCKA
jgi:hypothetical protein